MALTAKDPRWKTAAADTIPAMFDAWCDLVADAVEKKARLGFTPKEVKSVYAEDTSEPLSCQLNIDYKTGDPQEYSMLSISLEKDHLSLGAIVLLDGGKRDSVASKTVPLGTSTSDVANRLMEMLAGEFKKAGF